MKTIKIIFFVTVTIIVIFFVFLKYLGFFTKPTVTERMEGGLLVAGINFTGDYSKTYRPMVDVDNKLRAIGVECSRGFGIYYDDPKTTPQEQCRSFVGNVIETIDTVRLQQIKNTGLTVDSIPLRTSMIAEFKIKSKLSYMIGPMIIYPAIAKYMHGKQYKILLSAEIYDIPKKRILYIMQFSK